MALRFSRRFDCPLRFWHLSFYNIVFSFSLEGYCYLQDINKFLRYRTLCKSILKFGSLTKGIELTRFILSEVLGVPQFWDTLMWAISVGLVRKFAKYKWDYGIRNFSMLDKFARLCICSQHRVFPLPWWYFPVLIKAFRQSEKLVLHYDCTRRSDNF